MKSIVAVRFSILSIVVLLFTTGCGLIGGNQTRILGSESPAPLTGEAWLTCSQSCRDRAQCGEAQNFGSDVVLLKTDIPNTIGHNMIVGATTQVQVVAVQDVEVARIADPNSRYMARFYQVQVPNRAPAWVAGWCIEQ